jgi:hypothetical protein
MSEELNQVDVCFVIDTTGSMSAFLQAAKQQLLDTMQRLRAHSGLDLYLGLVEYRDHPPQDSTFVTRSYALTPDRKAMEKVIRALQAAGGGDTPEAVYDGIHAACTQMRWRAHSARFALLVGDAPPHGFRAHRPPETEPEEPAPTGRHARGRRTVPYNVDEGWANGCPCGLTAHSVTAALETKQIVLHALCMINSPPTLEAFTDLAVPTGGQCARVSGAERVLAQIEAMLTENFSDLAFDRQVLEAVQTEPDWDSRLLAERLGSPRLRVASSLARLGKRHLLGLARA